MSTGRTPVSLLNKRRRKEGRKQENEFVVLVLPMQNRHTYKGPGGGLKKFKIPILAARLQSNVELVF